MRTRAFFHLVLALLLLIGVAYLLFFSSFFRVKKIVVDSSPSLASQKWQIEKEVRAALEEPWLWLLKRNNFFLVDLKGLEEMVLSQYPQVKEAEIKRSPPDQLSLTLKERTAFALWQISASGQLFLVDGSGVLFEELATSADALDSGLLFFVFEGGGKRDILEEVISPAKLQQIVEVNRYFSETLKIEVESFILDAREKLDVKTSEGWQALLAFSEELDLSLTKLSLLLEREIPPEKRKNLEYIDLRFSKAYYRYRQQDQ